MTGTDDAGGRNALPTWNGDAATFQEYEEACLLWEQATAWEKRYLCGPKLAAALTGSAKRHVSGKNPSWLSHGRGVNDLLNHLRSSLGRPQVSDLTDHLSRYFKGSRRRSGESVNDYISRKSEIYLRACQALQRVSPLQKTKARPKASGTGWNTPTWSRRTSYDAGDRGETVDAEAEDGSEENQRSEQDAGSWRDDQWSNRSSWASGWGSSWWGSQWSWSAYQAYDGYATEPSTPELLPDYVQGWYLLHDSGLSGQERNVVQTALQGDFSVARVAQELRNQCAVLDSQRREYGARGSGYLSDVQDTEFEEPEAMDDSFLGDLPEAEMESWEMAENEAQEAMAVLHQAKRTLREARQRQNSVRLSRQYFRTNAGNHSNSGAKPRDDSKIHCLRCGQLGHRVANCPQPVQAPQAAKVAEPVEATSSFICYHELLEEQSAMSSEVETAFMQGVSTADAVSQGKAVIDGGATRTLASCAAMEAIMALNAQKTGRNGLLKVDKKDCPVFGFGNGETNKCTATVQLAIRADEKAGDGKGSEPPEHGVKNTLSTAANGSNLESLKAELLQAGEEVPTRWTKMDMEQRLRELREQGLADSEESGKGSLSTMESMNKELRRAARKKATLQEFCRETLGLKLTGNEVMSVLEGKALKEIMMKTPAEPEDYVGFGRFSKERYQTVLTQQADYADWVVTTYQESGEDAVDARLARLAKWLIQQKKVQRGPAKEPFPTKGYMLERKGLGKAAKGSEKYVSKSRGSQDAAEDVDPDAKAKDRQMAAMAETLELLRAEMAELKAERPRKTVAKADDEGTTDSSFSMM
ncbi:unnamed protein product [Symbiodinium sp. CCMP2592]|nr:unnamed protein product [Symbiodinium sp. CCMP2592]